MTPTGIKPTTFRIVAQCLNQVRHRVPHVRVCPRLFSQQTAIISLDT